MFLTDDDSIRILFADAGAEREALIAEANRRKLSNVIFMPPQPKERMPEVWRLCDVALVHLKDSPVFADVIPSKIFEAMGMGLPVVLAAPSGEARAIVEEDQAGLYVPAEDPDALAEALRRLAGDPGLRRRLAEASHAAAPRHSREHQAQEMLQVFENVIAGKGHAVAPLPMTKDRA